MEVALKRAKELNLNYLVVASSIGRTAENFLNRQNRNNIEVVCVTYHAGFATPGQTTMLPEVKKKLEDGGIKVLTTTHLLAGVDRALKNKFNGIYPAEIIAYTLRILGQGVKVGAEIACMALDAGLVPYGEDIITIAGSGKGADTALVIRPAYSNYFFETKIKEIICKPRAF
ncbi:MAG TPA: hypothetical protein DD719_07390 [Desulfotomaculum sp.]|nr:hypothetical protein [Desulfotomaculum sp.]HCJ79449.1 hypothetical protein [Desulfotomaculum sp.]